MQQSAVSEKLRPFLKVEYILLVILLIAIAVRFCCLDLKLFHHDEAIHAWFSYQLLTTGEYIYDPVYHGPFLYHVTAGMFALFGATDLVGRILPCVFGCALIPLLYWIYRMKFLSGKVVCIASLFIALSPTMIYFSRFLRNDVFVIFFSLLLIAAMLAWITRKKWYWLSLASAAAALGICCKENMPIIILTFAVFFIYLLWSRKMILPNNWEKHAACAILVFFAIVFTLYTSFWQHPEMVLEAGPRAITHWLDMHNQQRLGGPAGYYFSIFVLYEMPILLLSIWGIIKFLLPKKKEVPCCTAEFTEENREESAAPKKSFADKLCSIFKRPDMPAPVNREHEFIRFAIFWLIISLLTYAYIGEKVPWLSLHQLLPMILVAAFGLAVLKGKRQKVIAVITVVFLCIVTGATVFAPCDINGPIVQVQNSEELRPLFEEMEHADKVAILSNDVMWPFAWYFCKEWNEKVVNFGTLIPQLSAEAGTYDVLIAHDTESYDSLNGYDKRIQRLSYWFDAEATGGSGIESIWNWLKFYFTRDGASGSLNIAVYTKNSA